MKNTMEYCNVEIIVHYNTVVGQVIGVPDSRMGEEVCACIRLVDGAKLTADQVKQYCKGKVRFIAEI
jgi:acyl-CoA synthetase (AMP-forming)/AMP-acid ligase II